MSASIFFILIAIVLISPHVDYKFAYKMAWLSVIASIIFHFFESMIGV